jgi:hypothetical protein
MLRWRPVWLIMLLLLAGFLTPGFHLECRTEVLPHLAITIEAAPEGALESELLILTNQHRMQQGLHVLSPDNSLVRIAREHSLGMARQGYISHDLPAGNLQTRMGLGGYIYEVARENVASARNVAYAQNALLESPAHKRNILATDVDRVGIGIARCAPPFENQLFITEIFASPREEYQPAAVQDELLNRVKDLRESGAGSLVPDPMLEKLASDSVQSLHVPVSRQEIRSLLAASAGELQKNGRMEIARVNAAVQLVRDPKNLNIPNQGYIGQQARMFGTAVRRVVDSRNQPAFLVLTLIGFSN